MTIWNYIEAAEATGGKNSCEWQGNKISIDSRHLQKDDIFIALKGNNCDGHDYVHDAINKGASVAIVEKNLDNISPILKVDNCIKAINDMAIYRKKQSNAKLIAITGSIGKTSTKEMFATAFDQAGLTYASRGNYNNDLGLPISLASMPKNAEFGIFELGMNHAGEIENLSKFLEPDLSVITTIAPVHLEFFASVHHIALAKAEIFEGMKKNSPVILNSDNKYYPVLFDEAQKKSLDVISCGKNGDCKILEINSHNNNDVIVKAKLFDTEIEFPMQISEEHLIHNSIFVLAAAKILQLNLDDISKGLYNFTELSGRGKKIRIKHQDFEFTIIDDSYNASPDSVKASLKSLGKFKNRKIALLSDMLELGDESKKFHQQLKDDILNNKIDKFIACGNHMKELYDILPNENKLFYSNDLTDIINFIEQNISKDDILLVKGSYSTKIHKIPEYFSRKE